jgi:hypothetical protein
VRIAPRRHSDRHGPLALNWSGWRPTSLTMRLPFGYRWIIWERAR